MMLIAAVTALFALAQALPSKIHASRLLDSAPDSPRVLEALADREVYEAFSFSSSENFVQPHLYRKTITPSSDSISSLCPSGDRKTHTINGREYIITCDSAPWGTFLWLPATKSFAECEANCHLSSYDCNGITYFPSNGACALINSETSGASVWDNGFSKIGAIPVGKKSSSKSSNAQETLLASSKPSGPVENIELR